jgi:membrane peptidoglycan carboxypeptidase
MCCTRIGTVFGGTWPAEIWHKFMSAATRGLPRENFPNGAAQILSEKIDASRGCLPNKFTPAGLIQKQEFIKGTEPTKKCTQPTAFGQSAVPSVVGLIRLHAKSELESAGYKVDVVYQAGSGDPQDTVVSQSPAGGTLLKEQETVTIAVARDAPATTGGGKHSGSTKKSGSGTGSGTTSGSSSSGG